jgi:adenosylcobinamide-phosphate synthase
MAPVPDQLLILLIAIALDGYLGAPLLRRGWRWHPLIMLDRLLVWCDVKLNRPQRGTIDRRVRGVLALIAVMVGAGLCGAVFDRIGALDALMSFIVLLLLTALIDQRDSHDALVRVETGLAAGDRAAAEAALARITTRDPVHLDDHGLARAAIEARATRFARRGVAPILAYALFGLAGAAVWWVILAFERKVGGGDPAYHAFGWATRQVVGVATLVPDRLAGLSVVLVAPLVADGRPSAAVRAMLGAPGRLWSAAAAAGALQLALGGPRRYAARVVQAPWLSAGRARAEPGDVARARVMFAWASLLVAALVAAALVLRLAT